MGKTETGIRYGGCRFVKQRQELAKRHGKWKKGGRDKVGGMQGGIAWRQE